MTATRSSAIAQLLYAASPAPDFETLVAGMEKSLGTFKAERRIDWRDDDNAIFDIDDCRITLSLTVNPGGGNSDCLTLSAGPSPFLPEEDAAPFNPRNMCEALVDQLSADLPPDTILWSEASGIVTLDTLRLLVGAVSGRGDIMPPVRQEPAPAPIAATTEPLMLDKPVAPATIPAALPAPALIANAAHKVVDLRPHDPELARIRAALYPPEEAPVEQGQSLQMRLAVHSLNATLLVVLLPLGAAVTTYTLLRGADMRVTGRAMALGGFGIMLARTPMMQALIG